MRPAFCSQGRHVPAYLSHDHSSMIIEVPIEDDMTSHDAEFTVTSDPAGVDLDAVHAFIRSSYWAMGIPRDRLARAIAGSIPFSLLQGARQVGFARVITDRATFAYLADVYVLEEFRGRGLASRLMEAVAAHPDLQGLRRFALVTRDAHPLYRKFGFTALAAPERHMELVRPTPYVSVEERR